MVLYGEIFDMKRHYERYFWFSKSIHQQSNYVYEIAWGYNKQITN